MTTWRYDTLRSAWHGVISRPGPAARQFHVRKKELSWACSRTSRHQALSCRGCEENDLLELTGPSECHWVSPWDSHLSYFSSPPHISPPWRTRPTVRTGETTLATISISSVIPATWGITEICLMLTMICILMTTGRQRDPRQYYCTAIEIDDSFSNFLWLKTNPATPSPITQDLVDIIYEAVVRLYTNNTSHTISLDNHEAVKEETQIKHPEAEDRILDITTLTNLVTNIDLASTFSSLSGIFNFITSNMDVLTAIALVKHLENRAMYDPRQVKIMILWEWQYLRCQPFQVQRKLPWLPGE